MNTRIVLPAIVALCGFAASAHAAQDAKGGARITARVPEVCTISASPVTIESDGSYSGTLNEYCNSSAGYSLVALHRPLRETESATVNLDGGMAALGRDGRTLIAIRNGQRLSSSQISIEAGTLLEPLAVGFTVQPI